MSIQNNVRNLLDLNRAALQSFFLACGEKPYRAQQVLQWIHQYGVSDIDSLGNIGQALKQRLKLLSWIKCPEIVLDRVATDGTRKWLLRLEDSNCIETVFIPEAGRGTLCVSSQVGCALNCRFCSTAQQGYNRNLTVGEIIGQVWVATRVLSTACKRHDHTISNIVLMGMGEPLLNLANVVAAMDIMMDDFAYGLSKRRVTLSTSGIVPAIRQLAKLSCVSLAISLHAPNDELRNQLVPINRKYPLLELLAACRYYCAHHSRRRITIEYVMLAGANDQPEHARQLIQVLRGVAVKINLIPFNSFPNTCYQCSPKGVIDRFRAMLVSAGYTTITRKTRGDTIEAACGQLVGQVHDRSYRTRNKVPLIKVEAATGESRYPAALSHRCTRLVIQDSRSAEI